MTLLGAPVFQMGVAAPAAAASSGVAGMNLSLGMFSSIVYLIHRFCITILCGLKILLIL
jgi:hypothetical protein